MTSLLLTGSTAGPFLHPMIDHLYHCLPEAEQPVSQIVIAQLRNTRQEPSKINDSVTANTDLKLVGYLGNGIDIGAVERIVPRWLEMVGPVGLNCNIRWGYLQNASFWAVLTQPVFIEQHLSHEIEVVVGPMGFHPTISWG